MAEFFETSRRVEFRDTDMAGIAHFSVFFTYMEQAEHEFLRSVGLGVHSRIDGRETSWPRVSAQCDYRESVRFEQVITIRVFIERIGQKSITYGFVFSVNDRTVAEGKITAVCCHFRPSSKLESILIPDSIRNKLAPFLASG